MEQPCVYSASHGREEYKKHIRDRHPVHSERHRPQDVTILISAIGIRIRRSPN